MRKINKPAVRGKTVATPAAKASRVITTAKNAKPAKAGKAVAVASVAKADKPARVPTFGVNATAKRIDIGAANFGGTLSDRDNAYLSHYGKLCRTLGKRTLTLTDIATNSPKAASGKPVISGYSGSAKAHDAGVVQRLAKAGLVSTGEHGAAITFTAKCNTVAAFTAK